MLQILINRFKKQYRVLNTVEISKSQLIHNYRLLSGLNPGFLIAPVLKSNAYGHGIKQVGKILGGERAPFFCVDSLYEAFQLVKPIPFFKRQETPILIMGYTNPQNLKWKRLPFQWAIWDIEFAKSLSSYQKGARVHIFVDTGMNREGVRLEDLAYFLEQLKPLNLKIVGLMSHLAQCEGAKDSLFLTQLANFKKAKQQVSISGLKPTWFHLSASDPLMSASTRKMIFAVSNLARTGKALYGIAPRQVAHLRPVLQLKTQIVQIKILKKGEKIGYGGTYQALSDIPIAVLPIGYNDGLDRRLSSKGVVLIEGEVCPIIGRVSMNITSIDISKVKKAFIGQEVLVYSGTPTDPNSIEKVAKICDTIAHEILIREAPSTRRVVVE